MNTYIRICTPCYERYTALGMNGEEVTIGGIQLQTTPCETCGKPIQGDVRKPYRSAVESTRREILESPDGRPMAYITTEQYERVSEEFARNEREKQARYHPPSQRERRKKNEQ